MKATAFKVEGTEIKIPSHVDLVDGLDTYVGGAIDAYDDTVDAKIAALANVYVGKTERASSAAYAYFADKALKDEYDRRIATTYVTSSTTVALAQKAYDDGEGKNIANNYALKTGAYVNLTAGYATTAGSAARDNQGNMISDTYLSDVSLSSNSNGQFNLLVTTKRGQKHTYNNIGPVYTAVTDSASGLMTPAQKIKLDRLNSDTSLVTVGSAHVAEQLQTSRKISIGGGASGIGNFNGSADCKISLSNINADSITSGTLITARGGTGNSVGAAQSLANSRGINGIAFDGTSGVAFCGTCGSAGSEATKVVSIIGIPDNSVPMVFAVYFASKNTATNIMLNVNGTGAKPVYRGSIRLQTDQILSAYDGITVWFRAWGTLVTSSTGGLQASSISGYQIIDPSQFTEVRLTGVVSGTGKVGTSAYITIPTDVDSSLFEAKSLKATDTLYGGDLDSVKSAGFYRFNRIGDWKHRPAGTVAGRTYYMQVLKSGVSNSFFQHLYEYYNPVMYIRACPSGNAANGGGWARVGTTAVDTVETVSSGSSEEPD